MANRYKVANLPEIVVKRRARDESYFQRNFGTHKTNRRLARLCAKAVYEFQLPPWYYSTGVINDANTNGNDLYIR
ncbi:hypothetical protein THIOM_001842 [Candidatus Thiomargarita nelsonii]|uniref:Uncharacterized protein n=1 Tax=Candidatus Thiomargarita nelsonii TaxID=1003181 RepID=A0A176S393_9GAMM|nr:hypothetical protein THIOM_001842 [Candidatus Thiomargarita nelsonii]